jgi:hypothetical protein
MTSAPTTQDTLLNWHRRLGHVNIGSTKDMARNNRVTGLKFSERARRDRLYNMPTCKNKTKKNTQEKYKITREDR